MEKIVNRERKDSQSSGEILSELIMNNKQDLSQAGQINPMHLQTRLSETVEFNQQGSL